MYQIYAKDAMELETIEITQLFNEITKTDVMFMLPIFKMNHTYYQTTFHKIESKLSRLLKQQLKKEDISFYDKGYMYGRLKTFFMLHSIYDTHPFSIFHSAHIDCSYFIFAFNIISIDLTWPDFQKILLFLKHHTFLGETQTMNEIIAETQYLECDAPLTMTQQNIIQALSQEMNQCFIKGIKNGFYWLKLPEIIATNAFSINEIMKRLFNVAL